MFFERRSLWNNALKAEVIALAAAAVLGTAAPAIGAETAAESMTEIGSELETEARTAGDQEEQDSHSEAETAEKSTEQDREDYVVCKINGEEVMNSRFRNNYAYYVLMFSSAGYDVTSSDVESYIEKRVSDATIRNVLLRQGMEKDGYYDFTQEEEDGFVTEAESEMKSYQETYTAEEIDSAGYDVESLTDSERQSAAMDRLYDDLMDGYEITDDDIQEYYDNAVSQDEANYKDNEELYEKVSENTSADIWYSPDEGAVELSDEVKEKIRNILWENERNSRLDSYIQNLRSEAVVLTVADPDYGN